MLFSSSRRPLSASANLISDYIGKIEPDYRALQIGSHYSSGMIPATSDGVPQSWTWFSGSKWELGVHRKLGFQLHEVSLIIRPYVASSC